MELKTLVCDFIQDEGDQKYYLVQVKYAEPHEKVQKVSSTNDVRDDKTKSPIRDYVTMNKIVKQMHCKGDYCDLDNPTPIKDLSPTISVSSLS